MKIEHQKGDNNNVDILLILIILIGILLVTLDSCGGCVMGRGRPPLQANSEAVKYHKLWASRQSKEYHDRQREYQRIRGKRQADERRDNILIVEDGVLKTVSEAKIKGITNRRRVGAEVVIRYRNIYDIRYLSDEIRCDELVLVLLDNNIKYEVIRYDIVVEIRVPHLNPKKKPNFMQLLFQNLDNICDEYRELGGVV